MITFDQHQRCRLFANDVHPGGQYDPRARLNRRCARYTFLLRLPACVGGREADAAGTVARGPRVIFGKEEDSVGDVAAAGDGTQRGGTVEATVDAAAAVAAERPGLIAGVRFTVGTDKCPGLVHSSAKGTLAAYAVSGTPSLAFKWGFCRIWVDIRPPCGMS